MPILHPIRRILPALPAAVLAFSSPGQHRRRGGADNRFGESHQLSGGKNGLSRLEKFPQIFRGVQLWRREKSALLHMRQKPLTRPRIARDKIVRHLIAEQ